MMDDKVAIVTGGASGIGLGIAEAFVGAGASVIVADIQDDKAAALERNHPDGRLRYMHCNVTRESDIAETVAFAEQLFGGLDVLVNNAGTAGTEKRVETMTVEAWNAVFALHVTAPMLGMKHAVPVMRRRGGGSIVNLASVAALDVGYGPYAYSSAKAAVIAMSRWAVSELSADHIRVNTICPGMIVSSIFGTALRMDRATADRFAAQVEHGAPAFQPIPVAGMPEDIAGLALYLASDAARFVTGTCIPVDGGVSIGPRHAWDPATPSPVTLAMSGVTKA